MKCVIIASIWGSFYSMYYIVERGSIYVSNIIIHCSISIYDVIPPSMTKIGTAKLSTWENELKNQGVDVSNIDFNKTIDLFIPNNKIDSQNLITSFIDNNGKRVYLQFNLKLYLLPYLDLL